MSIFPETGGKTRTETRRSRTRRRPDRRDRLGDQQRDHVLGIAAAVRRTRARVRIVIASGCSHRCSVPAASSGSFTSCRTVNRSSSTNRTYRRFGKKLPSLFRRVGRPFGGRVLSEPGAVATGAFRPTISNRRRSDEADRSASGSRIAVRDGRRQTPVATARGSDRHPASQSLGTPPKQGRELRRLDSS